MDDFTITISPVGEERKAKPKPQKKTAPKSFSPVVIDMDAYQAEQEHEQTALGERITENIGVTLADESHNPTPNDVDYPFSDRLKTTAQSLKERALIGYLGMVLKGTGKFENYIEGKAGDDELYENFTDDVSQAINSRYAMVKALDESIPKESRSSVVKLLKGDTTQIKNISDDILVAILLSLPSFPFLKGIHDGDALTEFKNRELDKSLERKKFDSDQVRIAFDNNFNEEEDSLVSLNREQAQAIADNLKEKDREALLKALDYAQKTGNINTFLDTAGFIFPFLKGSKWWSAGLVEGGTEFLQELAVELAAIFQGASPDKNLADNLLTAGVVGFGAGAGTRTAITAGKYTIKKLSETDTDTEKESDTETDTETEGEGFTARDLDEEETAQAQEEAQETKEDLDETLKQGDERFENAKVPIDEIQISPEEYQFRSNINAETGVDIEKNTEGKFDETLKNPILIHRRNGKLYLADGHHRLQIAKQTKGVTHLDAYIVEGSVEEVKRLAAERNIVQGEGTAIDIAKVLKAGGKINESAITKSEAAKHAQGLAKLNDEAFGIVVGNVKGNNIAKFAPIGEHISDKLTQIAAVNEFLKNPPDNIEMARQMAIELSQEDFVIDTDTNLFGEEQLAQSLAREKAEIKAGVIKKAKEGKRIFGTLDSRKAEIKSKGNQLNEEQNRLAKENAEKALSVISRTGKDLALTDIATRRHNGELTLPQAINEFTEIVDKRVEERYGKEKETATQEETKTEEENFTLTGQTEEEINNSGETKTETKTEGVETQEGGIFNEEGQRQTDIVEESRKAERKDKKKGKQETKKGKELKDDVRIIGGGKRKGKVSTTRTDYSLVTDMGISKDDFMLMPKDKQAEVINQGFKKTFGMKKVQFAGRGEIADKITHALKIYSDLRQAQFTFKIPKTILSQLQIVFLDDARTKLGFFLPYGYAQKGVHFQKRKLGNWIFNRGVEISDGAIGLQGQSKSFAHELGHAIDWALRTELKESDYGYLSQAIRANEAVSNNPRVNALAKVISAIFTNQEKALEAAEALRLEHLSEKTGNKKMKDQFEKLMRGALSANANLFQDTASDYYKNVRAMDSDYLISTVEMFARAWEAYVASVMGDTSLAETDYYYAFGDIYPKFEERKAIFHAFDDLVASFINPGEEGKFQIPAKELGGIVSEFLKKEQSESFIKNAKRGVALINKDDLSNVLKDVFLVRKSWGHTIKKISFYDKEARQTAGRVFSHVFKSKIEHF